MRVVLDAGVSMVIGQSGCRRGGIGALRKGLSVEEAAGRLWLMTGVEHYLQAIDRLGWSPARYEEWLHGMLERELLKP